MKTINLRTPTPRVGVQLVDLIAREHRRVERLTKERNRLQRKLNNARVRYSVLKRLANDQARRSL